ncbi:hypothetical protein [Mariniflexile sp. AS56]|uniref:hypothetical protein n=2 Tax=Mariniflexile sp. AS56 TaxID=3063957 RepID=UPI0026EB173A|nr:hypothetical protein [Mariniflexile sp. AS56]MDO7173276.1 hypothetical protein [Mariniflexile sp. AS56]
MYSIHNKLMLVTLVFYCFFFCFERKNRKGWVANIPELLEAGLYLKLGLCRVLDGVHLSKANGFNQRKLVASYYLTKTILIKYSLSLIIEGNENAVIFFEKMTAFDIQKGRLEWNREGII